MERGAAKLKKKKKKAKEQHGPVASTQRKRFTVLVVCTFNSFSDSISF